MNTLSSLAGIVIAVVIAAVIAAAGSSHSDVYQGVPVFAICVALAFVMQWVAFIPAWHFKTEKYYDLMGSTTYVVVVTVGLLLNESIRVRDMLMGLMIVAWAARLGSFLFARIRADGADSRFDRIKENFTAFLMTWTLQGLWVTVTSAAALAAITASTSAPLGPWALTGSLLWGVGFAIEVVADRQKKAFKAKPENHGRFITTGLWAWSRHPNYFGEIVLWLGIAVIAVPHLSGWQYATLISPLFVFVLLKYISGVPMLEARADRRWGDDPDYQAYKRNTRVLIPLPRG